MPDKITSLAGLKKAIGTTKYPLSPPRCPCCGKTVTIWDCRGGYCSEDGGCGLWTFPNKENWLEEKLENVKRKIDEFEAGLKEELKIAESCPVTKDNEMTLDCVIKLLNRILEGTAAGGSNAVCESVVNPPPRSFSNAPRPQTSNRRRLKLGQEKQGGDIEWTR